MTKYSMVSHRNSMTGSRTRVEDACESGLCPICIADCPVFCEVSKSALRGREILYPQRNYYGNSTAGSPKDFGLSYSDFQIQFEVRGAQGIEEDEDLVIFPNVELSITWGNIDQKLPLVIAGLGSTYVAKKNWEGLAKGAALSGISITIGENVVGMDPKAKFSNHSLQPKVIDTEDMEWRVDSFREFWDEKHGDIIVQKNIEDGRLGVFDYVTSQLEIDSLELKFGQGAKAIGGEVRLESLKKAQLLQDRGYLVIPDPSDPLIIEQWKQGLIQDFERHSRVGLSTTNEILEEIDSLRSEGVKNIFLKTGAYRPAATAWIIRLGVEGAVDGMTFDGAGGGTGMSPVSMMNEGSIPTVYLEALVTGCLDMIKSKSPNAKIPSIAIAGGFTNETQIFKALAMGAPYINCIAMARAPLTAVMKSKYTAKLISEKKVNSGILKTLGIERIKNKENISLADVFNEYETILKTHNLQHVEPSAVGLFTYLTSKLGIGLKQLLAGVRKFNVELIDRSDIACISKRAIEVCNQWSLEIESQEAIDFESVMNQIFSGNYK